MLNRLGLHVARLIAAHALNRLRLFTLAPLVSKDKRTEFSQNGFVVVTNFLPADKFDALRDQLQNCKGEVRECIQGDTLTHRILLDEQNLDKMPACRAGRRQCGL